MNYLYVIVSSILFGIIPSLQSLIMLSGASPLGTMTIVMSVSTTLSFIISRFRKTTLCINRQQVFPIIVAGVFLCTTDLLLDISYTLIPVGLTTMIHFMYPTIVCIINTVMFKEKGSRNILLSIILAIIGFICLGVANVSTNYMGILFAMITALTYGSYLIMSGRKPLNSITAPSFVFYVSLISASLGWLITLLTHVAVPNLMNVGPLVLLSSIMLFSATFLLKIGIKKIGSTIVSILSVIEPVTSLILSSVLFSYKLSMTTILGCMLLLLSLIPVLKQRARP